MVLELSYVFKSIFMFFCCVCFVGLFGVARFYDFDVVFSIVFIMIFVTCFFWINYYNLSNNNCRGEFI